MTEYFPLKCLRSFFFSFFYCYFHYLKLCHRLDLAFIGEMVQELVLPFDIAYEEL